MKKPMILQGDRRRARQFATLLDGGRVRSEHDLQPLVELVAGLRPLPIEPDAEFRAHLRDRLLFTANAGGAGAPAARTVVSGSEGAVAYRPWREMIATAAAVSVMTGIGAAAASTRALPGDGLYPLKRSIESIQISLANSDRERGRELLDRAQHRLKEAERLAASDEATDPETQALVDEVLLAMQADTTAGAQALMESYADSGDVESLLFLGRFAVEQRDRLDGLVEAIEKPEPRRLIDDLREKLTAMHAQVTSVTPISGPVTPRSGAGNGWGAGGRSSDERQSDTELALPSPGPVSPTPGGTRDRDRRNSAGSTDAEGEAVGAHGRQRDTTRGKSAGGTADSRDRATARVRNDATQLPSSGRVDRPAPERAPKRPPRRHPALPPEPADRSTPAPAAGSPGQAPAAPPAAAPALAPAAPAPRPANAPAPESQPAPAKSPEPATSPQPATSPGPATPEPTRTPSRRANGVTGGVQEDESAASAP